MLDYTKVPTPHMVGAVQRYFENRIPPGHFLTAVICNDLKEVFARADDMNSAAMHEWVSWFLQRSATRLLGLARGFQELAHRGSSSLTREGAMADKFKLPKPAKQTPTTTFSFGSTDPEFIEQVAAKVEKSGATRAAFLKACVTYALDNLDESSFTEAAE